MNENLCNLFLIIRGMSCIFTHAVATIFSQQKLTVFFRLGTVRFDPVSYKQMREVTCA